MMLYCILEARINCWIWLPSSQLFMHIPIIWFVLLTPNVLFCCRLLPMSWYALLSALDFLNVCTCDTMQILVGSITSGSLQSTSLGLLYRLFPFYVSTQHDVFAYYLTNDHFFSYCTTANVVGAKICPFNTLGAWAAIIIHFIIIYSNSFKSG